MSGSTVGRLAAAAPRGRNPTGWRGNRLADHRRPAAIPGFSKVSGRHPEQPTHPLRCGLLLNMPTRIAPAAGTAHGAGALPDWIWGVLMTGFLLALAIGSVVIVARVLAILSPAGSLTVNSVAGWLGLG